MHRPYSAEATRRMRIYPENSGMPDLIINSMNRTQHHYTVSLSRDVSSMKQLKKYLTLHQAKNIIGYMYLTTMSFASWALPVLGGKMVYDKCMQEIIYSQDANFQYADAVSNNAFVMAGITAIGLGVLVTNAFNTISTEDRPKLRREIEEISFRRQDLAERILDLETSESQKP